MHRSIVWGSLIAVSLGFVGAAFAEKPTKQSAGAMCPTDDAAKLKTVLVFLHEENQNEIKLGRMAITHAHAAEVKAFADRMVREHSDADQKLTDLAKKKKIALDPIVSADPIDAALHAADSKMESTLSKKNGVAFDAAYLGPQVMEHEIVSSAIEEAQKVTKDDDVKRLLSEMHATIDAHRGHADGLLGTMAIQSPPPAAVGGGPTVGDKMGGAFGVPAGKASELKKAPPGLEGKTGASATPNESGLKGSGSPTAKPGK